ncbi:hypothetical protein G7Z17_g996 [Cylindrodendrum hubeiense]|uniref:Ferric oxidoreductase domain-containing protein n=1 Tax=Cylindrodendrum hubeiense TaxID=595255 RepID=A0A9P5LLS7_9HYPO|nr:hypothetical protein G7Z17_g996 [Cylindrodendrum hubeiense]
MLFSPFAAAAALCLLPIASGELLAGYGLTLYKPPCAYACANAVPPMVDCPEFDGMTEAELIQATPSGQCLGNDTSYLSTVAWCINHRCESVELWKIEKFWDTKFLAGPNDGDVVLRYTYQEAIQQANQTKDMTSLTKNDVSLNGTMFVSDDLYTGHLTMVLTDIKQSTNNSKYPLMVFLSCVIIPIGFSFLRLLPFPTKLRSKFYAYVIDPPIFGKRHSVPVLGLGFVPTRGQALFIMYIIAINIVACCADTPHFNPNPNARGGHLSDQNKYIPGRIGAVSLANVPLLILYAGRNSLLLWLTNWSHSTFLLLHRWIGTICAIEGIAHSLIWLTRCVRMGLLTEQSKLSYWYCGVIATLAMTLLITLANLRIRKAAYEAFLIGHIFLAIIAFIGAYYHLVYAFKVEVSVGFIVWIYIAMGIWGFDRLLRIIRISKHGLKRAYITAVDEEHIRVDIPGVACHGYCYAYFPTLSWRMWENHPFSVKNPRLLLASINHNAE